MPRGARGKSIALQEYDVLPAQGGQVIRDGGADDAATYHHDTSVRGQGC